MSTQAAKQRDLHRDADLIEVAIDGELHLLTTEQADLLHFMGLLSARPQITLRYTAAGGSSDNPGDPGWARRCEALMTDFLDGADIRPCRECGIAVDMRLPYQRTAECGPCYATRKL